MIIQHATLTGKKTRIWFSVDYRAHLDQTFLVTIINLLAEPLLRTQLLLIWTLSLLYAVHSSVCSELLFCQNRQLCARFNCQADCLRFC